MVQEKDFYSITEASEACGLPEEHLKGLISQGIMIPMPDGETVPADELADTLSISFYKDNDEDADFGWEMEEIPWEDGGIPRFFTLKETEIMTGIPARHFRKLIDKGELLCYPINNETEFYLRADIIRKEILGGGR